MIGAQSYTDLRQVEHFAIPVKASRVHSVPQARRR